MVILGRPGAVAAVEKPPQKEFPSFRGPTNSEFADTSSVILFSKRVINVVTQMLSTSTHHTTSSVMATEQSRNEYDSNETGKKKKKACCSNYRNKFKYTQFSPATTAARAKHQSERQAAMFHVFRLFEINEYDIHLLR